MGIILLLDRTLSLELVISIKELLTSILRNSISGLPWRQWLRICLPMKGPQVWSLSWEDSTCQGASEPGCHKCWAHTLELLKPACLEPTREATAVRSLHTATVSSPCSLQLDKAWMQQLRPRAAKQRIQVLGFRRFFFKKETLYHTKAPHGISEAI